jgi:phospholipid transport system substrate-binding protein
MKGTAMKTISRLLLIAMLCIGAATLARAAGESPDAMVKNTVEEVLGVLKQNQDRAALRKLAEQKVLPHFDFKEMTRLAVGAAWRKATPEQQRALEDNFRTLLVNTYTNALSQAGGAKTLEVRPAPASKGGDTTVKTVVKESGKQPVAVDYRMSNKEGEWKVFDVLVEGVSLVTNYRTSFAEEVNRAGIDGLIKSLQQRNHSLAKG